MAPQKTDNSKLIASLKGLLTQLPAGPWKKMDMGHPEGFEDRLELVRLMDSQSMNIFESWEGSASTLVARNGTGDLFVSLSKALPAAIEALEVAETSENTAS